MVAVTYPRWLVVIDVRSGIITPLQTPRTPWGDERAGAFTMAADGRLIMAPWSAGRFWASRAPADSTPSLILYDLRTSRVARRFGVRVVGHNSRYGA
ncbi:MAG: hypothetical protein ACREA0_05355, partial [bacterium]